MNSRQRRHARRLQERHVQASAVQAAGENDGPLLLTADVSVAAAAGEGKRPTFAINAYNGGALRVGGWYQPVVVDLAGLRAGNVTILLDHDPAQIVGQGRPEITATAVHVTGTITGDHTDRNEPAYKVVTHARNGFAWSASVGVAPERVERVDAGSKVTVNGREFTGPVSIVRAGRLGEVSFVGVGADETASAKVAAATGAPAANQGEHTMTFEQWVQAKGFDPATLTAAQRATLQAAYNAEQSAGGAGQTGTGTAQGGNNSGGQPAGAGNVQANGTGNAGTAAGGRGQQNVQATGDSDIADITQRELDERARRRRIRDLVVAAMPGASDLLLADLNRIGSQAIEAGWAVERADAEIARAKGTDALRQSRGGVRINTGAGEDLHAAPSSETVIAGLCMAGKLEGAEKHFSPATLEAAERRWHGALGIVEVLAMAAAGHGHRGASPRTGLRPMLRAAFGAADVQAGYSTIDISGILSAVANKFLLQGMMAVEQTWREIAAIRPVPDFKTITSYRLTGTEQYEKVAPNGELKHGTLGEETYTNKADTYGLLLQVGRQDIINDDLGAITTVPRKLGRGSGLKLNDVFWTVFLNNAAFFVTANGNYTSGAGTALSIDALTTVAAAFMNMTDTDGKPTGIDPKILLVPPILSATAQQLYKSMEIRDTNSNVKYPVANPHVNMYRPVVSRYLSNTGYTGYSTTAWYLLADPNDLPVIEVAFLNGQQNPTVETAEADFNTLGIQMRGYHDFGVSLQDPKGGYKSAGA
jgi:hypothetical protein